MRRGETVAGLGADAGGWGLPGRDATGRAHRCVMAVRAVAQKHREEASGKRVQDWQAGARLASGFTIGRRVELALDEQMHDGQASARLARKCTMGEALHDG